MIRVILAVSLSCFLISCSPGNGNDSEDPVLHAYRLIDEQRTEEAITFLEEKLSEKPGDYDLTMTLASAYAHQGGVKIQKFIPLIKQISQMQDLLKQKDEDLKQKEEEAKKDQVASGKSGESAKEKPIEVKIGDDSVEFEIDDLAFSLNQAGVFLGLYATIPDITPEKIVYVDHAIQIMNNLGPKLKVSDKTYRVVLNIIRLKNWIAENLVEESVSILKSKSKSASDCLVNPDEARKQGLRGLKLLRGIIKDVSEIRPETKEKIQPLLARSDEAMQDLTASIQSGKVMTDEEQQQLTDTVIQNGFGKILKCDGESAAQP